MATRGLLSKIQAQFPSLPLYLLTDGDPHGMHIAQIYRHNSQVLPPLRSFPVCHVPTSSSAQISPADIGTRGRRHTKCPLDRSSPIRIPPVRSFFPPFWCAFQNEARIANRYHRLLPLSRLTPLNDKDIALAHSLLDPQQYPAAAEELGCVKRQYPILVTSLTCEHLSVEW